MCDKVPSFCIVTIEADKRGSGSLDQKGGSDMPQSVFNRYEKKYLMPERVYQELRGRLSPYMQVDSYGLHTICNIYYDTPDDLLVVHFDDVAVYRHLAKIRSHVLSTELRHLRLNHSFLVI